MIPKSVTIAKPYWLGMHVSLGEQPKNKPEKALFLTLGPYAHLHSFSVIYLGSTIGSHFTAGNGASIREHCAIGDHVTVGTNSVVLPHAKIGNHVTIHSLVLTAEHMQIGEGSWIGPGVILLNTKFPKATHCQHKEQSDVEGAPIIGKHVRIGGNATILPYTKIGDNSLVAAGAVVVEGDYPPNSVLVGNPARVVKTIKYLTCHPGEHPYTP